MAPVTDPVVSPSLSPTGDACASLVVGHEHPRLLTPALRELTPETSKGFALIAFAARRGVIFMPWQRQAAIRALELNPDGTYRFKKILILVGRQSGKTTLLKVWAAWRLEEDSADLVLGTAQDLDVAHEAWQGTVDLIQDAGVRCKVRVANGQQCITLANGARYKIKATTRGAGRGLSVDMLVLDEIREQRDWLAWAALSKTTIARPHGQIICISNAGDDESVVLNSLRTAALAGSDPSLCLLEWSAPDGCALDDPEMWAYSCPALGHTIEESSIRSSLATDPPGVFRTEILCQHVSALQGALDASGWAHGADPTGSIAPYRGALYAGVDVSMDGRHVALVVAAATGDGQFRVEPVASWSSTNDARAELPALLLGLAPLGLAWFPSGPANALAAILGAQKGSTALSGTDTTAACMGLVDLVASGNLQHNASPLLDTQVATASRVASGDSFRFTRRGGGDVNAVYAMAAAVRLAQLASLIPRRSKVFVL